MLMFFGRSFAQTGTLGQITAPSPGAKLTGTSVTFTWTAGSSATAYWLYLGTTGPQSANLYSSGSIQGTSVTVSGLPANGVTVYATLFSEIDGVWTPAAYTFTEAGSPVLAAMSSPTAGSTLAGTSATFTWSAGAGPTAYWLYIGTTGPKSANVYNSGILTGTSAAVSNLPAYGVTLYVTLFSEVGTAWQPVSYTYMESGSPVLAALTTPTPGTALAGSSVTFSWTTGGGPTAYWLYLGTTGPKSANIYNSGAITGTSVNLNVPANGVTLYVTLFSYINGTWQPAAYTLTESGTTVLAALTSPAPGSTLPGPSVTFTWSAGGGPTAYWLYLGTTGPNSANLYSSGTLTGTSATVSGLPTTGATIYATLFSEVNGAWQPVAFTYKEALPPATATMISPVAGSVLGGSSVTFSWTAGSQAQGYWLYLGTTGAESANIYDSGAISGTSVTVSGLPANGVNLYATLFTKLNGTYTPVSYTYTQAGTIVLAALTSPAPGSTFTGASETFNWTAGTGPAAYWLYLGTTGAGSANLYNSGTLNATSVTVNGLPTTGATIYATLFSEINGAWQPVHFTYLEAPVAYQVQLSWDAVTGVSPAIEGYNVYRAISPSTTYTLLNPSIDTSTTYTDKSVQIGMTYDYYIESVDTAGLSSAPSTVISVPIT